MRNRDPSDIPLLVVEDDPRRQEILEGWIQPGFRTVVAWSAGQALGVIERDPGHVYGGILLDHDLQERTVSTADEQLSGMDVADAIIRRVNRDVPILVHSINETQSAVMVHRLKAAGFEVWKYPMTAMTPEILGSWLDIVREAWEDAAEE